MAEDSIEDAAVYADGHRIPSPIGVAAVADIHRATPSGFAWVTLHRPDHEQIRTTIEAFGLDPRVADSLTAQHHRPRLQRYPDSMFITLRAGCYDDLSESVEFGEVHAVIGQRVAVLICESAVPDLARLRRELEAAPGELAGGPGIVALRLVDLIVDDYQPIVYGLDNDIDEIDAQVFTGHSEVSKRIYQLTREVIEFQGALRPVAGVLADLRHESSFLGLGGQARQELRSIEDHVASINERINSMREALVSVLNLQLALQQQGSSERIRKMSEAALKQAQDSRRIAAWAGVIFVPSLITGVYGMNFRHMPELGLALGYPLALLLMAVSGLIMWLVFRWQKWL